MRLTRIRLKNFQRHRRLDLRLDDELTTIVGNTDAGKSAVVRAIRWVLFNKPAGMGFIHKEEAECSVRLDFDSFSVIRIRSKSKNEYRVMREGKRKRLVSFKSSPPDLVLKLLNMNDVNLQMQFDSPFWLSQGEMAVSKLLNEVVNLESIDKAREKATSQIRADKKTVEIHSVAIERMTGFLQKYEDLDERRSKLKKIDGHLQTMKEMPIDTLELSIIGIVVSKKTIKEHKAKLKKYEDLRDISAHLQTMNGIDETVQELGGLIDGCSLSESIIEASELELVRIRKELSRIKKCPTCNRPFEP